MSLPYIFSSSFDMEVVDDGADPEGGAIGEWDSETDTGTALDVPHYSVLASLPGNPVPYRGAACMRIADIADANDHTVTEGDINVADNAQVWVRWAMYISDDFTATVDDNFNIFEFQDTSNVVEACCGLTITASDDTVAIGIADGATAGTVTIPITKGVWHEIELYFKLDLSSEGQFELHVDKHLVQDLGTTIDAAGAITHGVLGTQLTLSTTDLGYLLFDAFVVDTGRVGISERYTTSPVITGTEGGFAFVGPGRVEWVSIIDGGSNDVEVELYDVNRWTADWEPKWRGRTVVANTDVSEFVDLDFKYGCLVRIVAGTLGSVVLKTKPSIMNENSMKRYAAHGPRVPDLASRQST